jgi:hypothetical protein
MIGPGVPLATKALCARALNFIVNLAVHYAGLRRDTFLK